MRDEYDIYRVNEQQSTINQKTWFSRLNPFRQSDKESKTYQGIVEYDFFQSPQIQVAPNDFSDQFDNEDFQEEILTETQNTAAMDAINLTTVVVNQSLITQAAVAAENLDPVINPAHSGLFKTIGSMPWLRTVVEVSPWFFVFYSLIQAWDVLSTYYQLKKEQEIEDQNREDQTYKPKRITRLTWQNYLVASLQITRHLAAAALAAMTLLVVIGLNATINALPMLIIIGARLACTGILFAYHLSVAFYRWYDEGFQAAKVHFKAALNELLIGTLEALSFIFFIRLDKLLHLQSAFNNPPVLDNIKQSIHDTYQVLEEIAMVMLAVATFGLFAWASQRAEKILQRAWEFFENSDDERDDIIENNTKTFKLLVNEYLNKWDDSPFWQTLLWTPVYAVGVIMEGASLIARTLFKLPVGMMVGIAYGGQLLKNKIWPEPEGYQQFRQQAVSELEDDQSNSRDNSALPSSSRLPAAGLPSSSTDTVEPEPILLSQRPATTSFALSSSSGTLFSTPAASLSSPVVSSGASGGSQTLVSSSSSASSSSAAFSDSSLRTTASTVWSSMPRHDYQLNVQQHPDPDRLVIQ